MSDDLQSFLATFVNQNEEAAGASRVEDESDDSDTPGSLKLQAPSNKLDLEDMSSIQPICTPITRMESTLKNLSNGRLVAVNENYICYSIKGNLIRCIHFVHVTRTKLEEHPAALVDMEFAEHSVDLLASLDESGVLRIRRIYESDDACLYNTELEVTLPVARAQRVRWGPPGSGIIAVACDDSVVLVNYAALAATSPTGSGGYPVFEAQSLSDAGTVCTCDSTITDICFSPDYSYLLVTTNMSSCLYSTSGKEVGSPKKELSFAALLPTTSQTMSSGMFVGSTNNACGINSVIIASTNNRVVQLWKPNGVDDWTKMHEVIMEADTEMTPWTNIGVDTTGHCIIIATVNSSFFNVIHLNHDNDEFDQITKWEIAHPILSFSTGFPSLLAVGDEEGENELNMYCIQTKAIQKYTIEAKQCGHTQFRRVAAAEAVTGSSTSMLLDQLNSAQSNVDIMPRQAEKAAAPSRPLPVAVPTTVKSRNAVSPPTAVSSPPPPPPRTISPRAVAAAADDKSGGGGDELSGMEERMLRAVSKMMDEKLKRERQMLSQEFDQKLSNLSDVLSKNVLNAVDSRAKKQFSDLESKLRTTIQTASNTQSQGIKTAMEKDQNRLKSELLAGVIKDIKQPIQQSFKECFVQLLVPSLETSTQRMFDQIDASLADKFNGIGTNNTSSRASSAAIVAPPVVDPKEELKALLNEDKIDEALMKVLGAKDIELVLWLCNLVDQDILHDTILSQTVCICLLQQLGRDLDVHTTLKLGWLKEITLKLDPDDASIAKHLPKVVSELKTKMKEFQQTEKGRAVRTELIVIQRVLP